MGASQRTDTGLQPERTTLSFVRTNLSILTVALACLHSLPPSNATALAGPTLVGSLVIGVSVHDHRSRALRTTQFVEGYVTPAIGVKALSTASVMLLSLTGLWILVQ